MNGFRVAVGSHNYRISVEPEAGQLIIYSTDSAGGTEQARVSLNTDGTIDLNGTGKTLVTHAELDTALQLLITALNSHTHPDPVSGTSGVPTTPLSLDISAAEASTLRTDG